VRRRGSARASAIVLLSAILLGPGSLRAQTATPWAGDRPALLSAHVEREMEGSARFPGRWVLAGAGAGLIGGVLYSRAEHQRAARCPEGGGVACMPVVVDYRDHYVFGGIGGVVGGTLGLVIGWTIGGR
jgi:hypothetical protein